MDSLIFNSILGMITGYGTNALAIKSLFKKDGVIEKEYDIFIKDISNLIEKDLINHNTLKPEINSKEFKNILEEIIKTFFVLKLPTLTNKSLKNVNGYQSTINNIISFSEKHKKILIKESLEIYLQKPLKFYISNELFEQIIDNIDTLFEENKINLEQILYSNISIKPLNNILSNRVFNQLKENVKQVLQDINFNEFDGDINKSYNEFISAIDIEHTLFILQNEINNARLKEFINDSSNLSYELIDRMIKILKSPSGEKLLEVAVENFLNLLKEIDMDLGELLGDVNKDKLIDFINKTFPKIINSFINKIETEKIEIETLINTTIDDYLDSSISGNIFKVVKNLFYGNLSKKNNIVSKIINEIEANKDETPAIITQKLIEFLTENKIKDIIIILEKEGILSTQQIVKLIQLNLNDLKSKKIEFIDEYLNKKVEDIYKVDLMIFKEELIYKLFTYFKENYLYKNRFKEDINSALMNTIDNLKSKKIADLMDNFNFNIEMKPMLMNFQDKLDIPLKEITSLNVDFNLKNILKSYEDKKLNSFITPLKNEETYSFLSDKLIYLLNNNLANILEGKISVAVSQELYKFEPSQIRDMVENFMGKELGPINIFGAGLGGVAGGLFSLASTHLNPSLNLLSPLVYAITGSGTNYIAIKMLFQPYEKKWYLPKVSPGIVAKNKSGFATNIADFVKNDILNDKTILNLYTSNKEFLEEKSKEFILNDNFRIIEDNIKLNNKNLSQITYEKIIEYIQDNNEKLAEYLLNLFEEHKYLFVEKSEEFSQLFMQELLKKDFSEDIKSYVIKFLTTRNLNSYVPALLGEIEHNIDFIFETITKHLDYNFIKQKILGLETQYQQFIEQKILKDFIPINKFSKIISNKITTKLSSDDFIDDIFNSIQTKYINPEQKLRYLFDSKLETLLNQNIDYLIDMTIKQLQTNQEMVIQSVLEDLGWKKIILETKVRGSIEAIFNKALPKYLNDKKSFIKATLTTNLLDYKLKEIGINNHLFNDSLKDKIRNIIKKESFNSQIDKLTVVISETLLSIDLKTALNILNIRNLRQLVDILSPILENGFEDLKQTILENKSQIIPIIHNLSKIILEDITNKHTLLDFIKNIDLKKEIKYSINKLKMDKNLITESGKFLEEFLFEFLNSDFYSKTILFDTFKNIILSIDKEPINKVFIPFLEEFFDEVNSLLDEDLKEEILNDIIKAISQSLGVHIGEIVSSIDIQKIIESQINQMHPKEIEDLFYSFAGNYFKTIINKGGLYGAGAGSLEMIISLIVGKL